MNNRQLKFRAWDFIANCWVSQINTVLGLDGEIGEWEGGICSYLKKSVIVQQFTGLQDSTGKDIYEGDIVKTDTNHFTALLQTRRESEEYAEYTKGEVRWWNEGFAVCQENIGATRISEYASCDCCPCGLTIIGNIFEGMKDLTI